MRRAILPFVMIIAMTLAAAPRISAEGEAQLMNGIGLIDYQRAPDFKVGTWTKYRVIGQSAKGRSDDYELTIGIAGEERFWGEDCFWVETLTRGKGGTNLVATLMSYAVFDDSIPFTHMQYYTRKNITEQDAQGVPQEETARRPPPSLKYRGTNLGRNLTLHIDTLGTDTVTVTKGTFVCRRVSIKQDLGVEIEKGDSTAFSESRDHRDTYVSRKIPLTGIAREDIEFTSTLKTWMAGRSKDAPTVTISHSTGQAVLVDYGEDYKAMVIPAAKRHSLRELDRAAAHPPSTTPPRKPAPHKPS